MIKVGRYFIPINNIREMSVNEYEGRDYISITRNATKWGENDIETYDLSETEAIFLRRELEARTREGISRGY